MMVALKSRYDDFVQRVLASLSEIERRDVRAFDRWFYANGGWLWLIGVVAVTTLVAWVASQLPWNMSFAEAAILFNVVVLTLMWSGLSAWFGYRRFQGRIFRYIVVAPLLALAGALVGASIAGLVQGVDPFAFVQDSAKLRHVITAGLVFGFLFAFVTDTGVGLAAAAGASGIGLADVRERLALLYGDAATLELAENEPRGFSARILLPAEKGPRRHFLTGIP